MSLYHPNSVWQIAHASWIRSETVWKLRSIFERPELGFRKRIVVADARPGVAGGNPEVGEQLGDELAPHRRAAVGVNRQLVRRDALLLSGRRDQALRELRALAGCGHPADHVAAEEIQDHIEREVEK